MKKFPSWAPGKLSEAFSKEAAYGAALSSALGLAMIASALLISAPMYAVCFAVASFVSSGIALYLTRISGGGYDDNRFIKD